MPDKHYEHCSVLKIQDALFIASATTTRPLGWYLIVDGALLCKLCVLLAYTALCRGSSSWPSKNPSPGQYRIRFRRI